MVARPVKRLLTDTTRQGSRARLLGWYSWEVRTGRTGRGAANTHTSTFPSGGVLRGARGGGRGSNDDLRNQKSNDE
ncbi:hypothetical protein E2C01_048158 [Portunus trituberculatus]|uniref:Uncharacterized protein n=1 Tax=Portunus trituberculatus TaxID=210409 RepID=A0A5B7GAS9_PORTR|nr:hypothetical protein [Portunus trituberculatus]